MPAKPVRVVLDTNVMVRGIGNRDSPSGRILELCDQRLVIPLISRPVVAEYRQILNEPEITARYPTLNSTKIEAQLARLSYIGDSIRNMRTRFAFPRDPKDAKFIEVAIAGAAAVLITCDRDLLSLPTGHDETARRFRQRLPLIHVAKPDAFLLWFHHPNVN